MHFLLSNGPMDPLAGQPELAGNMISRIVTHSVTDAELRPAAGASNLSGDNRLANSPKTLTAGTSSKGSTSCMEEPDGLILDRRSLPDSPDQSLRWQVSSWRARQMAVQVRMGITSPYGNRF